MAGDRLIGASVEDRLDAVLWRVIRGELQLNELTPALRAFYLLGFEEGALSRQAEIDRLVADRDRLHLLAYNTREQVREIYRRRLDEGAVRYWAEWLAGLHDIPQSTSQHQEAA